MKYLRLSKTNDGNWLFIFPETGRTWLYTTHTFRELIVVFLFALEQLLPMRQVIGKHFFV